MLCPFYRYIDKRAAYALPPEILTYGDIFYISVPVPIFSQFNFSDAFIVLVVKIYYLILSVLSIYSRQSDYFSLMQGIVDCLCCTWAQLFLIIKHTDDVLCMIDHIIISFFITGNIRRMWNNNRIVCVLDQLFQSMFTLIRPFRVIADEGNYNDNFNIKVNMLHPVR